MYERVLEKVKLLVIPTYNEMGTSMESTASTSTSVTVDKITQLLKVNLVNLAITASDKDDVRIIKIQSTDLSERPLSQEAVTISLLFIQPISCR